MRCTLKHLAITVVALCLGLGTGLQAGAHEGPTRADGLGNVHFAVSCTDAAQAQFHRAMALYHSFDWPRGKAAFAEIASLDPRCGMAQWGLAMVAADNPFGWPVSLKLPDGAEAIQQAQAVGATTPRERDYIAALAVLYKDHATVPHRQRALAYEQAMEKLAATYPDDVEAKILSALVISANHDLNDKTFARPLKAAALLEPLFVAYPQHPGVAHYLIHSYDYPPIAQKGLEAAKRYAGIAPDASHAHHMPSHIFTRVGFWRESVASNQASVAAAKGDALYTLHGWDYMVYAYLQMADDATAEKVGAEALAHGTLDNVQLRRGVRGRGDSRPAGAGARPLGRSGHARPAGECLGGGLAAFSAGRSRLMPLPGRSGRRGAATPLARARRSSVCTPCTQVLTERKLAYWAEQTEIQAQGRQRLGAARRG